MKDHSHLRNLVFGALSKSKNLLTIVLSILLSSSFSFGQDYINKATPFIDDTPDAIWNRGNYLEINYELRRETPTDLTNPNFIPITDIMAIELVGEISIRSTSYAIRIPGISLRDGKFTFLLFGPAIDRAAVIEQRNYRSVKFSLKYKLKETALQTPESLVSNQLYAGNEGSISIVRVAYNLTTNQFIVDLQATHGFLDLTQTDVLTFNNVPLSIFQNQQQLGGDPGAYKYRVTLIPIDGIDVIKLAGANANRVNVRTTAAAPANLRFAESSGLIPLVYDDDLKVTQIENHKVYGLNPMQVMATTNKPSKSLRMIFLENPLTLGQIGEIQGRKTTSNNWLFDVPSNSETFRPGTYRVTFKGNDLLDRPVSDTILTIEKRIVTSKLTTYEQDGNSFVLGVEFNQKSPGPVKLVFLKNGSSKILNEENGKFATKVNLLDDAVKENIIDSGGNKYLNVAINAYGNEYNNLGIKVVTIDKDKAKSDLESITGTKNSKRQQIREYLEKNNFTGNMEEMTATIFDEVSKRKSDRDWSQTWQNVGKFLKPAAGLLMLLI